MEQLLAWSSNCLTWMFFVFVNVQHSHDIAFIPGMGIVFYYIEYFNKCGLKLSNLRKCLILTAIVLLYELFYWFINIQFRRGKNWIIKLKLYYHTLTWARVRNNITLIYIKEYLSRIIIRKTIIALKINLIKRDRIGHGILHNQCYCSTFQFSTL